MKTKNDHAWEKLFENYNILDKIDKKGYYEIKSSEINEHRESRLMAKFDYKNKLPKIFKENNLSILPISRSKYLISNIDVYHTLEEREKKITNYYNFPDYVESIDYNNIKSETQVLNCAYFMGIIDDFLDDEYIIPTVSGRMTSGQFKFKIKTLSSKMLDLSIDNSQIEIDGAYEGVNFLSLFEAKLEFPENFLIRQLYFPFKTWKNKISKNIKTIFLVYSNGIFSLYEYTFDHDCYNSIKLVKQKNYSIIAGDINIEDIKAIANSINVVKEPTVAFPQANVFERVVNLCELLTENRLTIEEIVEIYSFDIRQARYYSDAGRYLGLIEKEVDLAKDEKKKFFNLTEKGYEIFNLNLKDRQLELVKCILEHEAFFRTYNLWLKNYDVPSRDAIVTIMQQSKLWNINENSTFKRRSSTVLRWVEWILNLTHY
jgi:hypothetical protein